MAKLIVLSGPSGSGKTSIARAILGRHPETLFSVSATTRKKREIEIDGKDYYFISRDEFERWIDQGKLIEWENIYGDYYGTPKSEVERATASGRIMVFDVDVKGALSIKRLYGSDALLIFVHPPSFEVLSKRLKNRKTETPQAFATRLERVQMELGMAGKFDHDVTNDELPKAIEEVDRLVLPSLQATATRDKV